MLNPVLGEIVRMDGVLVRCPRTQRRVGRPLVKAFAGMQGRCPAPSVGLVSFAEPMKRYTPQPVVLSP